MMLSPVRTALAFGAAMALFHAFWALLVLVGAAMALFHAFWALLVLVGAAQPLMDFLFWLHFVTPVWAIAPFAWQTALLLVLVAGVAWAAAGYAFALVWNGVHRRRTLHG